jgi:cell division inhibitor SepF
MSVLDKFLDAIRLNDDYEEEDADSDSFFDEEDDDIEEKPKKRFFRKLENEDEDEEEEPQAKASCSGFPESYSNEKESRCIKYGSMRHQTGFHGGYP